MFKLLFEFFKYFGKGKSLKVLGFLMISLVAGLLEFVGIGLIYPFLMLIMKPELITNSTYYEIFSRVTNTNEVTINAILIGIMATLMFLSKNLIMVFCLYVQNKIIMKWKTDINLQIMNFYINTSYRNILNSSVSEKIYNVTALSSTVLETFVARFFILVSNSIIIIIILTLLFIKTPLISLFLVGFLSCCFIIVEKFFNAKTKEIAPKLLKYSIENNSQVIENLNNLKEIRIFSAENYFYKKFKDVQQKGNDVILKSLLYSGSTPYVIEMFLIITIVLVAMMISYQNAGVASKIIAYYGLFLAVIFRTAPCLNRIQMAINNMNISKDIVKKMINEYKINKFDELENNKKSDEKFEYNSVLRLENISFEYEKDKPVLKNVNLEIKQGEFVGIIGLSGSGKTTLADIIMGLLPQSGGKIFVDNKEVTELNISSFRELVGYVPQEGNILEGTFLNNVAWGKCSDEIDKNLVIESLKCAKLYEVVEEKGGIEAQIDGLSQGQKQRLLIARALYKRPELIIFDEATSSLDVKIENEITEMLTNIKGKNTIIAIAHRLVTLKQCDRLVYLKEGKIVDTGTFEELAERYVDFQNLINLSKF